MSPVHERIAVLFRNQPYPGKGIRGVDFTGGSCRSKKIKLTKKNLAGDKKMPKQALGFLGHSVGKPTLEGGSRQ